MGSLFDGWGGFPLAGSRYGFEALWASEIEPSAVAVTRKQFPKMKHLGDICQIDGSKIEPVEVVTFGSPCQDLSVAGNRGGLDGERSGLFREAIRIIREMRDATGGLFPRYAIWENVPGAFSSNERYDFAAVLSEITETAIPINANGWNWARAGMVKWAGCSLAWRTLDAKFWGVPQRRDRIFLVVDFRGGSAGRILFKPESLLGYSEKIAQAREEITASPAKDACPTGERTFALKTDQTGSNGWGVSENVAFTLDLASGQAVCLRVRAGCEGGGKGALLSTDTAMTLKRQDDQRVFCPCPIIDPTRQAAAFDVQQLTSKLNRSNISFGKESPTLCKRSNLHLIDPNYRARRFTPLECERLQGYPDHWSKYGLDEQGKVFELSDSKRYQGAGNTIAIPCGERIFRGIVDSEEEAGVVTVMCKNCLREVSAGSECEICGASLTDERGRYEMPCVELGLCEGS